MRNAKFQRRISKANKFCTRIIEISYKVPKVLARKKNGDRPNWLWKFAFLFCEVGETVYYGLGVLCEMQ